MYQDMTHPAITQAERTGYPHGHEGPGESGHECLECGHAIVDGEEYQDIHGDTVCTECVYSYMAGFRKLAVA